MEDNMGAIPGSRASTEPVSRLGPSGFDPEREARAVQNIRAFSVYSAGKLPAHISEDLRIVADLAAIAMEVKS
jgi:hypothetical protein